MSIAVIERTLETVVERVGDPTQLVYDRLFRSRPDLEELFFMDADGGVRGSMLQQCFDCIFDAPGNGTICDSVIPSECQRHAEYGVEPELFMSFFGVVRDTFRDVLNEDWDQEVEDAWQGLLTELSRHLPVAAA